MRSAVGDPQKAWQAWRSWYARQSRIGRVSFWLFVCMGVLLPGLGSGFASFVLVVCFLALVPCLLVLLYRFISKRVLWKVRNRLILTYLLMGLAPVVLFGSLGLIAVYLLAGQYSASTVLSSLNDTATEVRDGALGGAVWTVMRQSQPDDAGPLQQAGMSRISVKVLQGGRWLVLHKGKTPGLEKTPFGEATVPAWIHAPYQGIVASEGRLYLCSEANLQIANHSVLSIAMEPLDSSLLEVVNHGLGRVTLFQGSSRVVDRSEESEATSEHDTKFFNSVAGGTLPASAHILDPPVFFSAPVQVASWSTGEPVSTLMLVVSRPSLLYRHLFSTSVNIGAAVRNGLIAIAGFFALVELAALLMAVRLSRTLTQSVAELYMGTREIDAGHLEHRIPTRRADQLGALATSFNGMASSIGTLLVKQREEERLRGELAIAQEVQANLFPRSPGSLPGFEMHAVCLPALTIGGDYYDFVFGGPGSVCLAFGDISGKGASAALLMASLHSAVRAYCLGTGSAPAETPSPARLLEMINRHLFLSTQSARYATLFLACYDAPSRKLTYANGGHIPPFLLSRHGGLRRLDCGGTVVGLLEDQQYIEAEVLLEPGDLLVAFTDGLTEPERGTVEFGESRLLDVMRLNHDASLPAIVQRTFAVLQDWVGDRERPDDMTLLVGRQL